MCLLGLQVSTPRLHADPLEWLGEVSSLEARYPKFRAAAGSDAFGQGVRPRRPATRSSMAPGVRSGPASLLCLVLDAASPLILLARFQHDTRMTGPVPG